MTSQELESMLLQIFSKHIDGCHIILISNTQYAITFRILGSINDMIALNNLIKKDELLESILNPEESEVLENTKSFGYLDCKIKKMKGKKLEVIQETLGYLKMYFC